MTEGNVLRLVTMIVLGVVLLAAVVGLTVVAVATDRDNLRGGILVFGGFILIATAGGVSWWSIVRHRWHLRVEREDGDDNGE